jgi:hypothetical protein
MLLLKSLIPDLDKNRFEMGRTFESCCIPAKHTSQGARRLSGPIADSSQPIMALLLQNVEFWKRNIGGGVGYRWSAPMSEDL